MIGINDLWLQVRDLLRKDHAGWISSDEFNRLVNTCQELLFDFYLDTPDERGANDALEPFDTTTTLAPVSKGKFSLPGDYKDRNELGIIRSACGDTTPYPATYIDRQGLYQAQYSPIRRPTLFYPKYHIRGNYLYVYPLDMKGVVVFRYYRQFAQAARAYVLNTTTQEEEYDSGNSVDLEWGTGELNNFIDLILFHKGLALRESELVQWIQSRKMLSESK